VTRRPRIALATYEWAPQLAPDDRGLIAALDRVGVVAEPAVWSRGRDWDRFEAVVVRSCWDYHRRPEEFLLWIQRLADHGIRTWNSPALISWNADKRYLLELSSAGVATVPTIVVSRGTPDDVVSACGAHGWTRFVVKPAVSASGYETHALEMPLDDEARANVARATALGDVLVQPFVDEIARDGEYSFTFIEGSFSHAAIKRAANGEFRVQTEYGGSVAPIEPSRDLTEQAARGLAMLSEVPLYARVDGVVREGRLLLTELELIEPNLFLEHSPGATDRLATAVAERLSSNR
jgi:glutathione synthase/RimK-type ligase-like ATP-grasp enzyme